MADDSLYITVAGYSLVRGRNCPLGWRSAASWRIWLEGAAESATADVALPYVNISGPGHLSLLSASRKVEHLARLRLELSRIECLKEEFWWPSLYKESPYAKSRSPREVLESLKESSYRFLVAYPMKKDPTWYLEPLEKRRRIMGEHIRIAVEATRSKPVNSITTYAFGIAHYEFLVIYEVDDVAHWIETVEALREAEARRWVVLEEPVVLGLRV